MDTARHTSPYPRYTCHTDLPQLERHEERHGPTQGVARDQHLFSLELPHLGLALVHQLFEGVGKWGVLGGRSIYMYGANRLIRSNNRANI